LIFLYITVNTGTETKRKQENGYNSNRIQENGDNSNRKQQITITAINFTSRDVQIIIHNQLPQE